MVGDKKWFVISLLVVAAAVLAACGTQATEEPAVEEPAVEEPVELTPVNIRLSWLVKGEFVHVYMAKEQGFFEDCGLDVSVLEGSPDVTPMQLIVSGDDQFAYVALDDVARGRAQGMPLFMTSSFLQTSPQSISALAPLENNGPQDLVGKTIVETPGGTLAMIWPAFMASQGLTVDDAELLVVDWGAKQPAFLEGEVPLMSSYITNDVVMIEVDLDTALNTWKIADYGFNILAHGVVTSEQFAADNPDAVRCMTNAVQRGAAWTVENPEEAAKQLSAIFADSIGDSDLVSEDVTIEQVARTIQLYHTPNTLNEPCGWIAEEDAERTISLLFDNGGIESRDPVSEYYTNEYIDPDISCPIPEG